MIAFIQTKLIKVTAATLLTAGLAACQTAGVKIENGALANGNAATIITKQVCGGGTHVAVVSYDKRGRIKGQTQSAGPDGCTTGANVLGNVAAAAVGGAIMAGSGGGSAVANVSSTAIAGAVAISN